MQSRDAKAKPKRGRPRRAATDAAIIRAAVSFMTEHGVQGTTLTAVADRAGVARATVYLRWPSRSALHRRRRAGGPGPAPVAAVRQPRGRHALRRHVHPADLRRAGIAQPVLPEIVRGVLAKPPELAFDSVAPRRREVARIYRERAGNEGFRDEVDPNLPFDVILGASIAYLLANGRPMPDDDANRLAEVVIKGLRAG